MGISKQKFIDKHNFNGGIITTLSDELMPNNSARYMLNCVVLSSGEGNIGVLTNFKGNTEVVTDLPDGENVCIGHADDSENNNFYYFLYNSNGFHSIRQYNGLTKQIKTILLNLIDTQSIDILNFSKDNLILHSEVVHGELLMWVDANNNARKTNIKKLLDKSDLGYGQDVIQEYVDLYKSTARFAPKGTYFSDTTKPFNRLYGQLTKYAQRFIYSDGEKSTYSDFSGVVLPSKEPFTGIKTIPSENNGIYIDVLTGSFDVKKIEIIMQSTTAQPNDESILNWVLIATLDKKKLNIPDNGTYRYSFYNDGDFPVVDQTDVIQPYSYIPKKPACLSVAKNRLTLTNGYEGFETVDIDVSSTVIYEDLFIEGGTEERLNSPAFTAQDLGVSVYLSRKPNLTDPYINLDGTEQRARADKRANGFRITVGNDVKENNIFNLTVANSSQNFTFSYKAGKTDSASTVANYFITQLANTGNVIRRVPGSELDTDRLIYNTSIDVSSNISFEFYIIGYASAGYFGASSNVNPVNYVTLKDTGESYPNIKLGSSLKFYIEYEDFDGRKSLGYTQDALITPIKTINDLVINDGKTMMQKPIVRFTINHKPPIWAKNYQILRSNDLVYQDYIQFLIQAVVDVQTTTTDEYLDLIVGSLVTYNKIHPNSNLAYEFTKGDRIRFIRKTSSTNYATSFYPFFETEILKYSAVSNDLINSNLTTNGTTTVTVASADQSNIGRIISIDGNEREILSVSSGTTYVVNSPIGESTPKTYLSYNLIDRRGVVRIRKPSTITLQTSDYPLVEFYTPSFINSESNKQCFEFQQKYNIINAGKEDRYHAGNLQNQSDTQPAILEIRSGTGYVRNRELPITNTIPNAQVVIDVIEDPSFSDFYPSLINDNGRANAEDNGQGEIFFGSRTRYSDPLIQDTVINGFSNFRNLARLDHNDKYGDAKLTRFITNRLMVFKELRDCFIPVDSRITQDNSGQSFLVNTDNFLNPIQYYAWDGGIGNNPESWAENGTQMYYVSANSGVIIRIGGNGEQPISKTYNLDNEVRKLLTEATNNKAKIFGGFDRKNGSYIITIEGYNEYIYFDGFSGWKVENTLPPTNTTYEIVTNPTNGVVDFTSPTLWTYTPNLDYVGNDTFSYRALINGVYTQPKNVCISILENTNTNTAWKAGTSFTCLLDEFGLRTGLKQFNDLLEYFIADGSLTGNTKPNVPTDPDYVLPIEDLVNCVPQPQDPTPNPFTFTDVTNAELNTLYTSNTITITGINIPVTISVANGEYSKNGGAFTSNNGTAVNNDTIQVRRLSSINYSDTLSTVFTAGGVSDSFDITTKAQTIFNVNVDVIIYDSYQNAYYNDDDTRNAAIKFDFADASSYLLTISNDIIRNSQINSFTIPTSVFTAPLLSVTSYLTTGVGITAGTNVLMSVFKNFMLQSQTETARLTDPPTPSDTEFQTAVTLNGVTGVSFTTNDNLRIEHKSVLQPNAVGVLVIDLYNDTTLDVCAFLDTAGTVITQSPVYRGTNNFLPNDGTLAANCWALASDLVTSGGSLVYRFEFNLAKLINTYPSIDTFTFKVRGRGANANTLTGAYSKKGAESGNMKMNGTLGSYVPTTENSTDLGIIGYTGKTYLGGGDGNIGLAYGTDILTFVYTVSTNTLTLL